MLCCGNTTGQNRTTLSNTNETSILCHALRPFRIFSLFTFSLFLARILTVLFVTQIKHLLNYKLQAILQFLINYLIDRHRISCGGDATKMDDPENFVWKTAAGDRLYVGKEKNSESRQKWLPFVIVCVDMSILVDFENCFLREIYEWTSLT